MVSIFVFKNNKLIYSSTEKDSNVPCIEVEDFKNCLFTWREFEEAIYYKDLKNYSCFVSEVIEQDEADILELRFNHVVLDKKVSFIKELHSIRGVIEVKKIDKYTFKIKITPMVVKEIIIDKISKVSKKLMNNLVN